MNNFMGMFSLTGDRRFSKKSLPLRSTGLFSRLFLLIMGLGLASTCLADGHLTLLPITNIVQSPGNPVTPGSIVSYTLTVQNTNAQQQNVFPNIQIISGNSNIVAAFNSTTEECSADGDTFFCQQLAAGQSVQYTLAWQPPVGQHDLVFIVNCSTCPGDSQSVTTNVVRPAVGTIQFSSASYQVSEQDGQAAITVTRTGGSAGPLSVRVSTGRTGDTATTKDYSFPSSEAPDILFWSDGDMSTKTLNLNITTDSLVEGEETLTLQLIENTARATGFLGKPGQATLFIQDSTAPPVGTIQFSNTSYQASEQDGQAAITVTRTGGSAGPLSIRVSTGGTGDTAATEDYSFPPSETPDVLFWSDGDTTTKTLNLNITADSLVEGEEILTLQLIENTAGGATGFLGKPGQATLFIQDSTVAPPTGTIQFSNTSYQASEQDGQAAITVTRTGGSAGPLSVRVSTGGRYDTATTEDYSFPPSEAPDILFWSDGDMTTKTLNLNITADSLVEEEEILTLRLITEDVSILGNPDQATLLIQDSTVAPPTVDQLKTISGNLQRGTSGTTLEPFVIDALDAAGNPVEGVSVGWEILPANGGTLPQLTTQTDANGQSSNTLTLETSERLVIRATVNPNDVPGNIQDGDNLAAVRSSDAVSVTFVVNDSIAIADRSGLSKNQKSVAKALDSMCIALAEMGEGRSAEQDDMLATCQRLETDDLTVVAASLDLLAHEEVTAQGRVILATAKFQSASVHKRLVALRGGARGINLSGLNIKIDGQTLPESVVTALFGSNAQGGSAGEEHGIASRWGSFVNATIIAGDKDKTGQETGFNFRAEMITAGADYRISDKLVVGGALGYSGKNSDFKGNAGDMNIDNWHLTAYGSYYRSESFYLDGLIRLGKNNIDTRRRINLPGDPLQEGIGDTTGWEYAVSLSSGYEYSRNALTFGPYGRLGYILASINGYTESASNPGGTGSGSVLTIDNQDVDSITAALGSQVSYAISARNAVYLLQLSGEWEHEFRDNSRAIAAQFAYDPTRTSFNIDSDSPDRNYFNLGLGVTAVFANGRSGFLHYESRLGQDNVRQYWINGGIRIEL